jgi:hypothetical protein
LKPRCRNYIQASGKVPETHTLVVGGETDVVVPRGELTWYYMCLCRKLF